MPPFPLARLRSLPIRCPTDAREPVQYVSGAPRSRPHPCRRGDATYSRHALRGLDGSILECNHDAALLAASGVSAGAKAAHFRPARFGENEAAAGTAPPNRSLPVAACRRGPSQRMNNRPGCFYGIGRRARLQPRLGRRRQPVRGLCLAAAGLNPESEVLHKKAGPQPRFSLEERRITSWLPCRTRQPCHPCCSLATTASPCMPFWASMPCMLELPVRMPDMPSMPFWASMPCMPDMPAWSGWSSRSSGRSSSLRLFLLATGGHPDGGNL